MPFKVCALLWFPHPPPTEGHQADIRKITKEMSKVLFFAQIVKICCHKSGGDCTFWILSISSFFWSSANFLFDTSLTYITPIYYIVHLARNMTLKYKLLNLKKIYIFLPDNFYCVKYAILEVNKQFSVLFFH